MNTQSFPERWKIWFGVVFVLGLAAGMGITELLSHRPVALPVQAAREEPGGGRIKMDPAAQRNIGLSLERAQVRNIERTIQTTGVVAPNESRLLNIRPLARGRIESVLVRVGDRVRAGQTLLVYDNIELGETIGQLLESAAALGKAEAEAQAARHSLERAKTLVDAGALAKSEYDRRTVVFSNALASIESEKAELAKIHEKLHRFGLSESDVRALNSRNGEGSHREASHDSVKAPFDGVVIKCSAAEGQAVDPQDELLTIADLSTVWVLADVYDKDIPAIREGQEAKIAIDSYPGSVFQARITYVSDFLDPKTRTAKVRCEAPNRDGRLKLDMFATVELPARAGGPSGSALMIPSSAIQQVNDRPVVFVKLTAKEFEPRFVQAGISSGGWVEIKSGIRAGEIVAAAGSFYLKSTLLRSEIGGEE